MLTHRRIEASSLHKTSKIDMTRWRWKVGYLFKLSSNHSKSTSVEALRYYSQVFTVSKLFIRQTRHLKAADSGVAVSP